MKYMQFIYVIVIVLVSAYAVNASAFQCNSKDISFGDSEYSVVKKCGTPNGEVTRIFRPNHHYSRVLFYTRCNIYINREGKVSGITEN